jgi:hypothetical protein
VFKAIRGRDGFTRDFDRGHHENLSGAISWLTFSRPEQLTPGEAEVIGGGNSQNRRFVLSGSRGAFAVQPSRPAAAASGASMSGRGDRRWRGAGGSHGHQPRQGAALFPDPVGARDLTKRLGSANPWGRTAFNRTDNILWQQQGRARSWHRVGNWPQGASAVSWAGHQPMRSPCVMRRLFTSSASVPIP